jgi:ATP-dependent Zn protease
MMTSAMQEEIDYSEFIEMLEEGEVEEVRIEDEMIYITPKTEEEEEPDSLTELLSQYYGFETEKTYVTVAIEDYNILAGRLEEADVVFDR